MAADHVVVEGTDVVSERLQLRSWRPEDAAAALHIYGSDQVTRWLSPAMDQVLDEAAMAQVLTGWAADLLDPPQRRWALVERSSGTIVGGAALLGLPPLGEDLEIGWQVAPSAWGHGYGAEAGHAVAHYAFASGVQELFAVVRPRNERGDATARAIGMDWVGETEKYYDMRLQVYRLLPGELDHPRLPGSR